MIPSALVIIARGSGVLFLRLPLSLCPEYRPISLHPSPKLAEGYYCYIRHFPYRCIALHFSRIKEIYDKEEKADGV